MNRVKWTSESIWLVAILLVAVIFRGGLLGARHAQLSEDRDAYRAIAVGLANGEGYLHPGTRAPTAYRPPAYPLVLAALFAIGLGNVAIASLHLLLGLATVYLTWLLGRRLGLGRFSLIAAGLVAVDPLLVRYTSLVMTETLATFLVTLFLWLAVPIRGEIENSPAIRPTGGRWFLAGIVFGLCALCRPTVWAFAGLMAGYWLLGCLRRRAVRIPLPLVLGVALVVSPWVVRNLSVFGKPILTTTHGGYTLLLGNNPVYYEEVVAGSWGAVWSGDSLDQWQRHLRTEMAKADPSVVTESDRDQWMYHRARKNIATQPGVFARACVLRLARGLWGLVPVSEGSGAARRAMNWGIGLFYALVFAGMVSGIVSLKRAGGTAWMPLLLLLLAFTAVHTLYWANVRMRAPLVPVIALLCARGVWLFGAWKNRKETPHESKLISGKKETL